MAVGAAGRGKFAGWMGCGAVYAASGMSALPGQRATRRHRALGEARKLASCRLQVGAPTQLRCLVGRICRMDGLRRCLCGEWDERAPRATCLVLICDLVLM